MDRRTLTLDGVLSVRMEGLALSSGLMAKLRERMAVIGPGCKVFFDEGGKMFEAERSNCCLVLCITFLVDSIIQRLSR